MPEYRMSGWTHEEEKNIFSSMDTYWGWTGAVWQKEFSGKEVRKERIFEWQRKTELKWSREVKNDPGVITYDIAIRDRLR